MRRGFSFSCPLDGMLSWRQATKAALIRESLYCLSCFCLHVIRLLKNEAVTVKIGKQRLSNSCLLLHGIGSRRVLKLAFCLTTPLHCTPSAHSWEWCRLEVILSIWVQSSVKICPCLTLIKLEALFWTSPWSILQIVTSGHAKQKFRKLVVSWTILTCFDP